MRREKRGERREEKRRGEERRQKREEKRGEGRREEREERRKEREERRKKRGEERRERRRERLSMKINNWSGGACASETMNPQLEKREKREKREERNWYLPLKIARFADSTEDRKLSDFATSGRVRAMSISSVTSAQKLANFSLREEGRGEVVGVGTGEL